MIALIDGDMAVYMATAGAQSDLDLGDGLGNEPFVDTDRAIEITFAMIDDWTKRSGAKRAIVCLSHPDGQEVPSFRTRLYPDYKGNRTGSKPLAYWDAIKAVKQEYEVYAEPGLEADDLMGIAGTSDRAQTVIVSRDKDMLTVPALVFNPSHDAKPRKINRRVADLMHLKQTMTGDVTDNYPGIPGVGDMKAQVILNTPHRLRMIVNTISRGKNKGKQKVTWEKGESCSIWQSMLDYGVKGQMHERDLIIMAQVSRILRNEDWDPQTKTIRLWRPDGKTEELKL